MRTRRSVFPRGAPPTMSSAGLGALALAMALAGCTGDPSDPRADASAGATEPSGSTGSAVSLPPASAGPGPTSIQPSSPVTGSAGPAAATSDGGRPSATVVGSSVAPSAQSTADRSVAPPLAVVRITAVSVGADDPDEQIVFTTEGGVPGWSARYVDAVRIDDEPVLTDGPVAMEIVLQAADPTGDQGFAEAVAGDILPGQDLVQEVLLAQYLADTVVFAVGLSRRVPFSVVSTATSITVIFHGP